MYFFSAIERAMAFRRLLTDPAASSQLENAYNRTGHVSIGLAQPDPFYPLHVWRFFPRVPENSKCHFFNVLLIL
jgi:hypothetical protein